MPICKFARACRLSVKALRHYDEERLLRPAHVDERTGYRYYTQDQVRDAVTIGMLRGPRCYFRFDSARIAARMTTPTTAAIAS
jgi:DNA-binding transcriptional MerR regulator